MAAFANTIASAYPEYDETGTVQEVFTNGFAKVQFDKNGFWSPPDIIKIDAGTGVGAFRAAGAFAPDNRVIDPKYGSGKVQEIFTNGSRSGPIRFQRSSELPVLQGENQEDAQDRGAAGSTVTPRGGRNFRRIAPCPLETTPPSSPPRRSRPRPRSRLSRTRRHFGARDAAMGGAFLTAVHDEVGAIAYNPRGRWARRPRLRGGRRRT